MTMSRAKRVERPLARLRAAGLRPVQIWLRDTHAPGFAEECARQSRLICDSETDESRADDAAWEGVSAETIARDEG